MSPAPTELTVDVAFNVTIDPTAYALEYGLDLDEVADTVRRHLTEDAHQALAARGLLAGTPR